MKRIIYLIIILITVFGLQSCDDNIPFFGSDDIPSGVTTSSTRENEDGLDTEEKKDSTNATVVATVAKNDSIIKALSDSVLYLSTSIEGYDNKVEELKNEITNIKETSVGVKSLFVYLAIYTLVIILLVLFLVNKKTMSKNQIKAYIHDKLSGDDKSEFIQNQVFGRLSKVEQTQIGQTSAINALTTSLQRISANQPQPGIPLSDGYSGNITGNTSMGQTHVKEETPKSLHIFYFEQPSNDKEFDDSKRKVQPTEDTLYKFTLLKNKKDEAEFVFEPSSPNMVNYALNVRNKKMDPVCDVKQNGTSGKFHCEPGEAKLKDGKWIVTKTAFIIFN